jgi:acetyl esterase/lipase
MAVIELWPGQVPGDEGLTIGPERVRGPADAPTKDATWITSVARPSLSVFPPDPRKNTGVAMVVCPGGGYWNLAWDLEGEEVAAWLNTVGITGIVLKYRVPRRPGQPEALPAPGPLLDAQRALSLVRSKAHEWHLDPQRIGMVGFSAGGHLAMATATNFDNRGYEPVDRIDQVSCRPDFAVVVYPGYLVQQRPAGAEVNTDVLAPYMRIPAQTPPIFLVHASDDAMAGAENSVVMYQALKRAGVSAELHLYASGGHGFGVRTSGVIAWSTYDQRRIGGEATTPRMRTSDQPSSTWPERCVDWLRDLNLLQRG